VHIVFRDIGQFKVDDVRELVDVKTACCDVGGGWLLLPCIAEEEMPILLR